MTRYNFIFSNEPGYRISRHIAFWSVLLLHFVIQNLIVGGFNEAVTPRSFPDSIYYSCYFFPIYIVFVYLFIYLLIPFFLFRNRYTLFFFSLVISLIAECIACNFTGMLYIHKTRNIPFDKITFYFNKYNTVVNGIFLPLTIFAISGGIRLAKKWYLEQKENERLAREKISRELQLLKTQLHPRFLFHALTTIKNHIRSYSSFSGSLLIWLSELLSYILYESDNRYVLVGKEIEIIKNYIDFERESATDILLTEISISGNTEGKYISPLLLLSFIETSFDCFAKENTKDPSLKLTINIWNNHLDYHLICNRFLNGTNDPVEIKLRFTNLEKQLRFLYPDNHRIEIITNSSDITIVMNLPVHDDGFEEDKKIPAQQKLYEQI